VRLGLVGVGNEAFDFLGGVIANGLHPGNMPSLTGALLNELLRAPGTFAFRHSVKQIGRDKDAIRSMLRSHQDDAGSLRLIAEPIPGRCENENQNNADDQVILPGGTREIPENQAAA